jgi:hypothetical protein
MSFSAACGGNAALRSPLPLRSACAATAMVARTSVQRMAAARALFMGSR